MNGDRDREPMHVHDAIAAGSFPMGGTLRCLACGAGQAFSCKQANGYLARGWPTHCGRQMTADRALEDPRCDKLARSVLERLTRRERQVAELVRQGMTNAEVGAALDITGQTVTTHMRHIFRRTGFSNRQDLAARLERERARVAKAAGEQAARTA